MPLLKIAFNSQIVFYYCNVNSLQNYLFIMIITTFLTRYFIIDM